MHVPVNALVPLTFAHVNLKVYIFSNYSVKPPFILPTQPVNIMELSTDSIVSCWWTPYPENNRDCFVALKPGYSLAQSPSPPQPECSLFERAVGRPQCISRGLSAVVVQHQPQCQSACTEAMPWVAAPFSSRL